jgi:hypothetical protein
MMRKIAAIVLFACAAGCQIGNGGDQTLRPSQAAAQGWFRQARYGIFVHYLPSGPAFNEAVVSFNVEKFADQIAQTGAGYVIFTLGQNSGYYCSPNATYDRLAGYQPGQRCSRRDLPMELADVLAKHRIRLMLYLPSRAPQEDKQAMAGLGDVHEQKPAPQTFTHNWSAVIREWSLRYGQKVAGWWFDGSYNTEGWDNLAQPNNWNTWADACRAGNPGSILAFNPGAELWHAFLKLTNQQDYTAGEQTRFGATPDLYPPYPNMQWHILSYLGDSWANPSGPDYQDHWMIDYVKRVNRQGGIVSIDVNAGNDGIYPPHLRQLITLGKSLKNR